MLNISHLNAHFLHSTRFSLQDICLHIKPGEKVALVGESGSGKSMLAQLILNLNPHIALQSGSVEFENKNLATLTQKELESLRGRDIAYIPQEPLSSLNPLHGLGLLGYESVVNRDYPVVFGTLYIFTFIALVIGIISDILYCFIDPRIHFGSKNV